MEVGLSLGDTSRLKEKPCEGFNQMGLGFNTTLSIGPVISKQIDQHQEEEEEEESSNLDHNQHKSHTHSTSEQEHEETRDESLTLTSVSPKDPDNTVLQLDLRPHAPVMAPINPPSNFFSRDHLSEDAWFQMDLCILSRGRSVNGEDGDERQMGCYKGSDDDNNGDGDEGDYGSTRKNLRLSKEQSGFFEESFKEHNTLNPNQKLALAKQLHLRPHQVEVWFQNRRARNEDGERNILIGAKI